MKSRTLRNPRVVLITGATGGLGHALAKAYAAPGRLLVLQGRDAQCLANLAAACRELGADVETVTIDLRDAKAWIGRLEALSARSPIELAIVNAAITSYLGSENWGEEWPTVDELIDVNLRAALATVHGVLPAMRERRRGQIALISSLSAFHGIPVTPSYCATKAALKAYGESLRGVLAAEGIAVNVVLPGFIETPMSARFPGRRPFLLSAGAAASIIRRGLARNHPRISFPIPLSWGMWWLSVLPPGVSQRILFALGYAGGRTRQDS